MDDQFFVALKFKTRGKAGRNIFDYALMQGTKDELEALLEHARRKAFQTDLPRQAIAKIVGDQFTVEERHCRIALMHDAQKNIVHITHRVRRKMDRVFILARVLNV